MRIPKSPQKLAFLAFRKIANYTTMGIEKQILRRCNNSLEDPPIFIIGAPRTGTTLLYQVMVKCFRMAYIPNISGFFYKAPVFASRIGTKFFKEHEISFDSEYGKTEGMMAPNEAGKIWNQWYPTRKNEGINYSTEETLDEPAKKAMYRTVRGIEKIFKSPFINKNVKHSVRIRSLIDIFPSVLFIQMRRDPERVATSLLHGRRKNKKDISDWWSVMPKEIDKLKDEHYLDQVVEQVYYIEKDIKEDIKAVGKWRLLQVKYGNLCENPQKEIERVREFASRNGLELSCKGKIPEKFKKSQHEKNVTRGEKQYFREKLEKLYN